MRLAVQGAWVADNLKRLGSGAFYHLAYATHQIHPALLARLRRTSYHEGRLKIYVLRGDVGYEVADGEVVSIHWFPEFIRVHFMIGKVYVDEIGDETRWEDTDYLVLP